MSAVYLRGTCRACRGPLQEILHLGPLRLNAFPAAIHELEQIPQVPLVLTLCELCGLVQLDRTVPPDWLYRTYWYRSGINETMVRELQDVVTHATTLVPVGSDDVVIDIGANDGTLLQGYARAAGQTPVRIAVEPALNLHDRLRHHCDELVPTYFPAPALTFYQGRARIVTAIAMCYDLEDPVGFFQALERLLTPDGIAVVQFQDLGQQLTAAAFDNICHEHLEYYTLWSLQGVVQLAGLQLWQVQPRAINGGSLRVILRRRDDRTPRPDDSVAQQLIREYHQGLDTPRLRAGARDAVVAFRRAIADAQTQIHATIDPALDQGLVVDVYGASTKGNVLLQVLGYGGREIRQAIDRSPEKVGHYTLTGIPIVGETRATPADLWLVPIWQFKTSALQRERWYLQQGGTLVFPLPQVEIVRESWGAVPDGRA